MVISILEIGRMVKLMEKVYLLKQMDHFIRVHGNKTNSTEKEKKFKKEEILFMKVILLKVKNKEKENQFLVKTFMKVISKMICFMVKASTQWQTQVVFMKANLKIIYSMETENLPTPWKRSFLSSPSQMSPFGKTILPQPSIFPLTNLPS